MAGLSNSEYRKQQEKKAPGELLLKFIGQAILLGFVLAIAPVLLVVWFGFIVTSYIVLGNWGQAIKLPDYK